MGSASYRAPATFSARAPSSSGSITGQRFALPTTTRSLDDGRTREKNHRGRVKSSTSLPQFVFNLLRDGDRTIVSWINEEEKEFIVVDSQRLASLWGDEKRNNTMNFDKLSRAMRTFYKKGIFRPVRDKRLVYQFGDSFVPVVETKPRPFVF